MYRETLGDGLMTVAEAAVLLAVVQSPTIFSLFPSVNRPGVHQFKFRPSSGVTAIGRPSFDFRASSSSSLAAAAAAASATHDLVTVDLCHR